ncbi:NAD-dependent succinate-semialdehyde dehydrogenase [Aurantiacibacter luteus]|uniref:Aldehyde dehydrogenase n=1 Tax=Aurantiacibacter luteus TaxID=1581420 RepID=A0A0G9MV40_9SPHN|nr:NAD-dependent succinate-semialdehyde dehydrogenase [Aurantiacibacter luteus]KLE34585.1 aldehyde dehydrogenase [Aurantiacibacter luteus]
MTDYPTLHMMIEGERVTAGSRRTFDVVNPVSGDTLAELPLADGADLDRALDAAQRGFGRWRYTPAAERARVLHGAAALIRERAEALARTATMEQGKPLAEAKLECMAVAAWFDFAAGECQRLYGRELVRPVGQRSVVRWEPVGPVAAFAPWNFPLANPGRKLGAAVAAGCSIILKSAEETPASALGVLQALYDAGLPSDVAQAVFGVPDEVSRHLLSSSVIRKLSFTGSTMVGKHLAKLAADNMIRTTMELGGHGPVLVFGDADIDKALATAASGKTRNAGQVCVSPTRFIVEENVFERFRDGMAERLAATRVGNGLDKDTQMGPMANARRPDAIGKFVADAKDRGARLATGGERIGNQGFFFKPTVLSEVPLDAEVMNEEPFGPLALVNPYAGEDAMIAEANRLNYGLAAFAWTSDVQRQRRIADQLEAGMVGINTHAIAGPDAPFQGVQWSGHGSEDGPEGVKACMVVKAVHEA